MASSTNFDYRIGNSHKINYAALVTGISDNHFTAMIHITSF